MSRMKEAMYSLREYKIYVADIYCGVWAMY